MAKPIAGLVCIVTGATRGIGKGIAIQLAINGAKVYITGRTLDTPKGAKIGGSLRDTANEIEARGGHCIPIQCDHSKDSDIEQLFEQVKRENSGQLDILVNNAYSAVTAIMTNLGVPFWEQPSSMWDDVNNVGLRNHYLCAVYGARMMVPRKRGLIVNISSGGGLRYLFNCPYGIGKEAVDRMAADCGFELRKQNVTFVSMWPGAVGTETIMATFGEQSTEANPSASGAEMPKSMQDAKKRLEIFAKGETPEFVGKCVVGLAMDPDSMKKSGKIVLTHELGREYGLTDEEGHAAMDMRQLNQMLKSVGYTRTAWFIPNFIKVPKTLMALAGNKFY